MSENTFISILKLKFWSPSLGTKFLLQSCLSSDLLLFENSTEPRHRAQLDSPPVLFCFIAITILWQWYPKFIDKKIKVIKLHACKVASVVSHTATLWTVAGQAPLSMGFSRQEFWSGLPCPPPGSWLNPSSIFPIQGSNPGLLCLLPCRWILYRWATKEAKLS